MTRVSENSASASLSFALQKAKQKVEDLQTKGGTLRNINKPSDDPISNVESLTLTSRNSDNKQYLRNINYADVYLSATEKSLEELSEIMNKAKEIAIAQSSDFFDENIRKNVSNEIVQLRNQALAIANKRVGNRYIFGGHSTLTAPFTTNGQYRGDNGQITLEVSKDFFVPINISGSDAFLGSTRTNLKMSHPFDEIPELKEAKINSQNKTLKNETSETQKRELASTPENSAPEFEDRLSTFTILGTLINGLENNDADLIQNTLEGFDSSISKLITLRTRVGSISSTINALSTGVESDIIDNSSHKSKLVDADVTELFSDLQKQQALLKTVYQSSQGIINTNLLSFLR
jgi:flagellar hook-associated protein 3 FlgL